MIETYSTHQIVLGLKGEDTWLELLQRLEPIVDYVRDEARKEVGEAKEIETGAEAPTEAEILLQGKQIIH